MRLRLLPLALTMSAALGVAAAPVASAATATPGANLALSYASPQINGTHVDWHWSVRNVGNREGTDVVLVSTLAPALLHVTATGPCSVTADSVIRCVYSSVKAGESEQGTITADLPMHQHGSIRISGRISWQEGYVNTHH